MMAPPSDTSSFQNPTAAAGAIRVLLVDDSTVIRGALTRILKSHEDINIVASVSDGEMAILAAQKHQPHIVIMDIEMPVMDGITALPKVMEVSSNSKVIMFSSLTEKGADVTMKALTLGAVECIVKPSSSDPIGPGSPFQHTLLELIRGLASTREEEEDKQKTSSDDTPAATSTLLRDDSLAYNGKPELVMIGSSTGGPQALFEVVDSFAGFDIPVIITQHMPAKFTTMLAQHIEERSGIKACEGRSGMTVENGHIYVAPGGYHMTLKRNENEQTIIKLDDGPLINFCKPAVDPMFESALEIYGKTALGVILTGMGSDGLNSAKALVEKGGRLIAQDEKTSIVWGMPGAVANAGLCSEILPLCDIGPWVRKAVIG